MYSSIIFIALFQWQQRTIKFWGSWQTYNKQSVKEQFFWTQMQTTAESDQSVSLIPERKFQTENTHQEDHQIKIINTTLSNRGMRRTKTQLRQDRCQNSSRLAGELNTSPRSTEWGNLRRDMRDQPMKKNRNQSKNNPQSEHLPLGECRKAQPSRRTKSHKKRAT